MVANNTNKKYQDKKDACAAKYGIPAWYYNDTLNKPAVMLPPDNVRKFNECIQQKEFGNYAKQAFVGILVVAVVAIILYKI